MNFKPLLLSLATALVCVSAFAQWQWIDKDGRKVFSDRAPPPDVLEKNILKRPASAAKNAALTAPDVAAEVTASSSAPKVSGVDKELEAKKKQAADAEAAKLKAEQERVMKAKIENCARAKQAKATYDSGVRMSRTNASGEREILDDAGRAAELKRIQSVMDSDCK
jgi:phosphate-selective porin